MKVKWAYCVHAAQNKTIGRSSDRIDPFLGNSPTPQPRISPGKNTSSLKGAGRLSGWLGQAGPQELGQQQPVTGDDGCMLWGIWPHSHLPLWLSGICTTLPHSRDNLSLMRKRGASGTRGRDRYTSLWGTGGDALRNWAWAQAVLSPLPQDSRLLLHLPFFKLIYFF